MGTTEVTNYNHHPYGELEMIIRSYHHTMSPSYIICVLQQKEEDMYLCHTLLLLTHPCQDVAMSWLLGA